jgi:hypothetical protein
MSSFNSLRVVPSRVPDRFIPGLLPPNDQPEYCIEGSYTNPCKNTFASNLASAVDEYVDCVFDRDIPYGVCIRNLSNDVNNSVRIATRCVRREERFGRDPYRR